VLKVFFKETHRGGSEFNCPGPVCMTFITDGGISDTYSTFYSTTIRHIQVKTLTFLLFFLF